MQNIREMTGEIQGVHIEEIEVEDSFLNMASRFASMPGTVLLMSGGDLDCSRYHILGIKPWLTFRGRGCVMSLLIDQENVWSKADPFETLRMILGQFPLDSFDIPLPIASGLMGYLAYDLKDHLEELPRTSIDDLVLPHICLFAPSILVVRDTHQSRDWLCIPNRVIRGRNRRDHDLAWFRDALGSNPAGTGFFFGDTQGFQPNFTRSDYMTTIQTIREYIASGHVYQVNMSQRFQMNFQGDAFSLFCDLFKRNPAPFFAFVNAGDHQIVSTSPERFLTQNGTHVETRPIKGTKPRGKNEKEDHALRRELEQSKKDAAELSMIVDLLRNDLGKVCKTGTVRVTRHKRLEAYENVFHLVSIVEGVLDKAYDSVDLIRAAFPGGSITGCPKVRAMEIIDELESHRRHIYTGSIGYISFHKTMDLSIAIRTATIFNHKIIFSVGGGIVYDSDPADEYDETLHKGKTLMEAFKGVVQERSPIPKAWFNGKIISMDQASINVSDLGFQYGYGFFETIRVDRGCTQFLDAHITRFNNTWSRLFQRDTLDLSWDEIIDQVIHENELDEKIAAVKIMATWGSRDNPPFDHTITILARPYSHRLEQINESGLKLGIYPYARQTPLADHKTLNYLYYYLAGKWAEGMGYDEALIMNPDKSISETNTANVLFIIDRKVIRPISPHVLPGIMEKAVCDQLLDWHFEIEKKAVVPKDLFAADGIVLTNSLMGAVPVMAVDGKGVKDSFELCMKINKAVLSLPR